jgi:hypothetical protein
MSKESKEIKDLKGAVSMIRGLGGKACVLGLSVSLLMVIAGCGSGSNATNTTPPAVVVSIATPAAAQTVPVTGTLAITAAVANTTNTAVTWTVNGVTNGNSTYGTIAGSGLSVAYTAPAAVPTTATFNVTATSVADNTKSASLSVTISAGVVVSMTAPTSAQNVVVNATLGFTASVAGTSNTGVTWTVKGIANGNSTYGTITGSGLSVTYTGPAAVPSPATFNITATSVADATKSASVSVTILPAVAVSIVTPANLTQSIAVNGTLAITAAVANTSNTAVTWTVNSIANGNSTYGTITGSGLSVTYSAPAAVPSPATFNVTATSVADNTKSASVSVTVAPGVAVSIVAPTGAQNVTVSSTLGITASVTGTSNTAVTWTVNSITNGNSTYGTITGSGLSVTYDAPAAVPSPATFNVTATSVADNTKSASVSVTIVPPVVVSITTPTSPQSLVINSTLGFTASVTGTSNTAITWSVNSIPGGNTTYGTISGSGLSVTYDAPAAVPSPATFSVTATSVADGTKSASVNVTILPLVGISILSPIGAQTLGVNGTVGITASVTGTSNTGVTWTVNGVTNGNSTFGTISGSGLSVTYDAPAAVPTPATFNVTATSVADNTKSASVSMTILAGVVISMVTPTGSQSLVVSSTLGFTASVSGTSNTGVTWTVNGVTNGNSTYGTIVGSGLSVTYDAPAAVPSPATFNVTATSVANHAKSASISVTITPAAAVPCADSGSEFLLSGQYAFSLSGYNPTGYLAVVGSLTADGSGHFTAGEVDSNGALGVQSQISINTSQSSYSVGSNHLGCATIVTSFGTFNTRLAVGGITSSVATAGRMVEWDAPASNSYFAATGQILQQTAPSAGPNDGNYAFEQFGGGPFAAVGVVSASGGLITAGEVDGNSSGNYGNQVGLTGSYTSADSNGRFFITTTWSGQSATHCVGYVVSGSLFLFLPSDSGQAAVGEMQQQTGTFDNSSLSGTGVIYMTGTDSGQNGAGSGGDASIGLVTPNGSGSMPVTIYENNAGSWETPNPSSFTCTYSIIANGRVTLSGSGCGNNPPVIYLTATNTGFMLNVGDSVQIGQVLPQVVPSGGFSSTSIVSGTFYFGDGEVVSYGVASAEQIGATVLTIDNGSASLISDYTSTDGQQADGTSSGGTLSVNPNGTFHAGGGENIDAIMISTTEFVTIDNTGSTYPIIMVGKQ